MGEHNISIDITAINLYLLIGIRHYVLICTQYHGNYIEVVKHFKKLLSKLLGCSEG